MSFMKVFHRERDVALTSPQKTPPKWEVRVAHQEDYWKAILSLPGNSILPWHGLTLQGWRDEPSPASLDFLQTLGASLGRLQALLGEGPFPFKEAKTPRLHLTNGAAGIMARGRDPLECMVRFLLLAPLASIPRDPETVEALLQEHLPPYQALFQGAPPQASFNYCLPLLGKVPQGLRTSLLGHARMQDYECFTSPEEVAEQWKAYMHLKSMTEALPEGSHTPLFKEDFFKSPLRYMVPLHHPAYREWVLRMPQEERFAYWSFVALTTSHSHTQENNEEEVKAFIKWSQDYLQEVNQEPSPSRQGLPLVFGLLRSPFFAAWYQRKGAGSRRIRFASFIFPTGFHARHYGAVFQELLGQEDTEYLLEALLESHEVSMVSYNYRQWEAAVAVAREGRIPGPWLAALFTQPEVKA